MIEHLPTVSLAELDDRAELLTRTDRKYVVPAGELDALVIDMAGLRVLEVDGRRSSRYESTYLDTVGLDGWAGDGRSAPGSTPTPVSAGSRSRRGARAGPP